MLRIVLTLLLALSGIGVAIAAANHFPDTLTKDVVIIGGGSSGTYAATRLTRLGYDVVVIEKSDHLGGHVNTYVDPASGTPVNVGVQVFENTSIVLSHFADLGVPVLPVPPQNQPLVYLDFAAGTAATNYTALSDVQVGEAMAAYAAILAANYSYLADGFYLPDPVPRELLKPFGQFAEENGLQDMVFLSSVYDQPEETWKQPTLYQFMNMRVSLVKAIIGPSNFVTTPDNSVLYEKAAELLGDKVLYNSTAAKVERSDGGVSVTVSAPDGTLRISAKKLLFATYPVLENFAGWDLSAEDLALFAKFHPRS